MSIESVQAFVDASRLLNSPDELYTLLEDTSSKLGFDYFAFLNRIDLPAALSVGANNNTKIIALTNFPEKWISIYAERNLIEVDPIVAACEISGTGFRWSQVDEIVDMTEPYTEFMKQCRSGSIGEGFAVPARIAGGGSGLCNFAVKPGNALPEANLLLAELVGIHAFHAARKIVERTGEGTERLRLSPRQRDCIELVGRGKTDWEIAQILGISPSTVKEHIDDARRKYGVSKRVQVVLRAAFEGEILLSSILR